MTSSDAPAGQYELSPRKSSFEYGANAIEHAGITGGTTLEDKGMNNESFEGLSKDAMKKLERKCTLTKDLHLTSVQYQTVVSILFVGYLLGQIPSNIILTRVKPSYYLPSAIITWGLISLCTCLTKSFGGIMAVKILLGFAESPFFSGALLMLSCWYKPEELAPRVAFTYAGNTVANGFGGLLAAGILSGLKDAGGIAGWRWLYIIEGSATILVGVFAFFMLPDFPGQGQKRWLSEQEQRFAQYRLALSANNEFDENGSIKSGLRAAFTDVKTYALVLIRIIVKTLGFSTTVTLLITAPVYFFGFFTSFSNSLIAARTGKRAILIMWPLSVDILGNIMVISSHATAVGYTGMFLMCAGSYSAFNVVQSWIGSTIPRTRTKRAIVYALVNMCGNSSNIFGAYFFPDKDAPHYIHGGITLSVFAAGGVVLAVCLGLYLRRLNKKAQKEEQQDGMAQYQYLY